MKKVIYVAILASIVFAGCKKAEMATEPVAPAATAPAVVESTSAVTAPAATSAMPVTAPETK